MNIMPITDDMVSIEAEIPLDYRAFIGSRCGPDRTSQQLFLRRLHMKTGGGRLARLFANNQWCFGDKLVDLAELEDMESHTPTKGRTTKVSL